MDEIVGSLWTDATTAATALELYLLNQAPADQALASETLPFSAVSLPFRPRPKPHLDSHAHPVNPAPCGSLFPLYLHVWLNISRSPAPPGPTPSGNPGFRPFLGRDSACRNGLLRSCPVRRLPRRDLFLCLRHLPELRPALFWASASDPPLVLQCSPPGDSTCQSNL